MPPKSPPTAPSASPVTPAPPNPPAPIIEINNGIRFEPLDLPPVPVAHRDGVRMEGARHVGNRAHDPRMDPRANGGVRIDQDNGHRLLAYDRGAASRRTNLPTPGALTEFYAAAEAEASAAQGAGFAKQEVRTKWVKVGIQPSAPGRNGFTVVMDQYDGDALVKTLVKHNLTSLAARETLAMHLVAMHAAVGL